MTTAHRPAPVRADACAGGRAIPLRQIVIVLTAVLGILASMAVFMLAMALETRGALSEFENKAKLEQQVIDGELQAANTLLRTFRAYFEAVDHPVSRAEFGRFSTDLHDRVAGMRDAGWAPRVTRAERADFERAVRASGEPDFQILERGAAGKLTRAGDRPAYYPILYLDSGAVKRPVLGFDLASEPTRATAIGHALQTRQPAATPPINLITVARPRGGVMGFIAVEGGSVASRGSVAATPARGIVLGAVEIDVMMENVVADKARRAGIDVLLYDPAGPPGNRLIYWRPARSDDRAAPAEQAMLAGTHWQGTVSVFDQKWAIVFRPAVPLEQAAWNWHTLMPLIVGLALTGMIVAYLLNALRHTERLERLADTLRLTTEDLHRNAERIAHMARHDTLTGMPNRALFAERMDEATARLRRGMPFAVLCLDLDRFKAVNDRHGHGVGDRLLAQVAGRLSACVRDVDTIARLGGDEFAVILTDKPSAGEVERIARRLIEVIGAGFMIDGHTVTVGLSVGIVIAPGDGSAAEILLARADRALYAAKAMGRGRYCFHDATADTDVAAG
jgi:diguanylate cyclase (GGDEF)-like protein